jgi:hypothetical protein
MTTADAFVGTWRFDTYKGQPYTEPKIIMTIIPRAQFPEIFGLVLTREETPTLHIWELPFRDGRIEGEGTNQVTGEHWWVRITLAPDGKRAEAEFDNRGNQDPSLRLLLGLIGTWGAEKIGG